MIPLEDAVKLFYKVAWLYGELGCPKSVEFPQYRIMEAAARLKSENGENVFSGAGSETLSIAGTWKEYSLLKHILHRKISVLAKMAAIVRDNFKSKNQTILDGLDMLSCEDISQHVLKRYGPTAYYIKDFVSHFNEEEEKIKKLVIYPYINIRHQKELYNQFMVIDLYNLCGIYIRGHDVLTTPWSLTGRLPFIDQDLINFSGSVPLHLRGSPYVRRLMRIAFRGYLPPSILERKKPPHLPLLPQLYHSEFGELASQILDKISFIKYDTGAVLNKDMILKYIRKFMMRRTKYDATDMRTFKIIDRLVALETWYKTFIEREDIRKPLP